MSAATDIEDVISALEYASEHPGWIDCFRLASAAIKLKRALEELYPTPKPRKPIFLKVIEGWLAKGYAVEVTGGPHYKGRYRMNATPIKV